MARNAGRSYAEQWQAIANDYFTGTARHTATSREIAAWAIKHGKWKPSPMLLLNKATEDVARAMREEYAIDPQGRRARVKHAARVVKDGVHQVLWADFRDPAVPRGHVELALKQRRGQIVGDCLQLKVDADTYNQHHNPCPSASDRF